MIKKLILGISILFSTTIFAQQGAASPYSSYGLGEVKPGGTIEARSMGGLGVIVDSSRINLQNPASYSFLKYTSYAVGATNKRFNFKTNSQSENAQRTTLDYLVVGVPMGKLGMSFGLMPYTSVGYNIERPSTDSDPFLYTYTGTGGVNRVFVGGSYKFSKGFSVGANVKYNFGHSETKSGAFNSNVLLGSRTKNESRYSGLSAEFGVFYHRKIKGKYDWQNSFVFTPETKLHSKNTRNVAVVGYTSQGAEIVYDQQQVTVPDTNMDVPMQMSFGTAFGSLKKWMLGAEYAYQGKNSDVSVSGVQYQSGGRFSLGGYIIPKYNSFSNYFAKMTYRAGYKFENTGLVINGKNIVSNSATLGFGFPVGASISSINLGLEYGKRGTKSNGLIEENYFGISLGLSFGDRWFVKPKYD